MRSILTLADFRKTFAPGGSQPRERGWKHSSPDVTVRMGIPAQIKAVNEDKRHLIFTISDESVDRYGDVIYLDGWDWEDFLKNPVVPFGHDYASLPVARALDVWREGKALKALTEWPAAELSGFGDRVYRHYLEGYLNAVSVGFSPREWAWAEEPGRSLGINFYQQDLLEFSAVTVPANPNALIDKAKMPEAAKGADAKDAKDIEPEPVDRARALDPATLQAEIDLELARW